MAKSEEVDLKLLGNSLHQKLIDGDVTAPAQIAEVFLQRVVDKLQRRYPNLADPHLVQMAADDAIINYFQHPHRYDPAQSSLDTYLTMSARCDLLNLLRGARYSGFPKNTEFVELDAAGREYKIEVKDEDFNVEEQALILASPVWTLLEQFLPDMTDREVALLMLEGVRETEEYAHVLGIDYLPKMAQATEVKRHKDRIKKSLGRHIDRSELDMTI
jgi:DNA-directed RNA polymerase specialized sigma24 family protein